MVVEFDTTTVDGASAADRVTSLIKNHKEDEPDIIVFPEYALGGIGPQNVPDPLDKTVLCQNETYADPLNAISCAAKESSTYVVLNVLTTQSCSKEKNNNETEESTTALCKYNSNVVFNRDGALISM